MENRQSNDVNKLAWAKTVSGFIVANSVTFALQLLIEVGEFWLLVFNKFGFMRLNIDAPNTKDYFIDFDNCKNKNVNCNILFVTKFAITLPLNATKAS